MLGPGYYRVGIDDISAADGASRTLLIGEMGYTLAELTDDCCPGGLTQWAVAYPGQAYGSTGGIFDSRHVVTHEYEVFRGDHPGGSTSSSSTAQCTSSRKPSTRTSWTPWRHAPGANRSRAIDMPTRTTWPDRRTLVDAVLALAACGLATFAGCGHRGRSAEHVPIEGRISFERKTLGVWLDHVRRRARAAGRRNHTRGNVRPGRETRATGRRSHRRDTRAGAAGRHETAGRPPGMDETRDALRRTAAGSIPIEQHATKDHEGRGTESVRLRFEGSGSAGAVTRHLPKSRRNETVTAPPGERNQCLFQLTKEQNVRRPREQPDELRSTTSRNWSPRVCLPRRKRAATTALGASPDNGHLWWLRGIAAYRRADYDQARTALEHAGLLVPLDGRTHVYWQVATCTPDSPWSRANS